MLSRSFWFDALERAAKTFAQATAASIVAANVATIAELDLVAAAGVGALGALLSLLSSIASTRVGAKGEPSAVRRPSE